MYIASLNTKKLNDILCVGEILIDLIGQEKASLKKTKSFQKLLGGSPTNVAINTSRLGLNIVLIGSVGADGFGAFARQQLNAAGIDTSRIIEQDSKATSVIVVSKSEETPEFIPFRQADSQILEESIPPSLLEQSKIFHTTCFALSQQPAQATLLKKAEEAFQLGCRLSIDLNYAAPIWSSTISVQEIIKTYAQWNPLVKISEVDVERIFQKPMGHEEVFEYFHQLGVETLCLTLGSRGVKLSHKGQSPIFLAAEPLPQVVDVTGAGDAFWSGFIYGFLQKYSWLDCLELAQKTAALKLQNLGHLPKDAPQLLF